MAVIPARMSSVHKRVIREIIYFGAVAGVVEAAKGAFAGACD